ncbi:hypothetical protein KIPB_006800, partial [Kipferlia bialata]
DAKHPTTVNADILSGGFIPLSDALTIVVDDLCTGGSLIQNQNRIRQRHAVTSPNSPYNRGAASPTKAPTPSKGSKGKESDACAATSMVPPSLDTSFLNGMSLLDMQKALTEEGGVLALMHTRPEAQTAKALLTSLEAGRKGVASATLEVGQEVEQERARNEELRAQVQAEVEQYEGMRACVTTREALLSAVSRESASARAESAQIKAAYKEQASMSGLDGMGVLAFQKDFLPVCERHYRLKERERVLRQQGQ